MHFYITFVSHDQNHSQPQIPAVFDLFASLHNPQVGSSSTPRACTWDPHHPDGSVAKGARTQHLKNRPMQCLNLRVYVGQTV